MQQLMLDVLDVDAAVSVDCGPDMEGQPVNRLFGVPLLLVSLITGLLAVDDLSSTAEMKGWVVVPARVNAGGVDVDVDSEGESKQAYVEYEYEYDGRLYYGDRVNIYVGSTSVGSYQAEMGRRMGDAESSGQSIDIFVNPRNPEESIVDRELSWSRLAFKLVIFLLLGVGGVQTLMGKSRFAERG